MEFKAERRMTPRIEYLTEVHCEGTDGRTRSARISDVSAGGLYIDCMVTFRVGEQLKLRFKLGEHEIRVVGEVRHRREGVGMGVQFLGLSAAEQQQIRDFIAPRLRRTAVRVQPKPQPALIFRSPIPTAFPPPSWARFRQQPQTQPVTSRNPLPRTFKSTGARLPESPVVAQPQDTARKAAHTMSQVGGSRLLMLLSMWLGWV
jgi:hypothetical protein